MIVIIGPYPKEVENQDGVTQRIVAVDSIFSTKQRTYLRISFKKYLIPEREVISPGCIFYKVHFVVSIFYVIKMAMLGAKFYVHSIGNTLKIIYALPFIDYTLDFHGVVPEELSRDGKAVKSKVMAAVEWVSAKFAAKFICVSNVMIDYYYNKYSLNKDQFILLPIMQNLFGSLPLSPLLPSSGNLRIVYSGGLGPWQNIDKMIDSMMKSQAGLKYEIYTPNVEEFTTLLQGKGINYSIQSLIYSDLKKKYVGIGLGFLLRENDIINNVSCPTKLTDYIEFGIVPIMIQPEVGDMNSHALKYLSLDDFLSGKLPSANELEDMRRWNFAIFKHMQQQFIDGSKLIQYHFNNNV